MAAKINLTSVAFPGGIPPTEPMTGVVIRYRLTADPDVDGSYTTHTTSAVILTNGNFQGAPIVIDGLQYSTQYTVWVRPQCGSGAKIMFETPGQSCVNVNNIIGTTSE